MKIKFARLVGLLVLTVFVSAQAVEMVPIQAEPGDQPQPMPAPPAEMDDFNNPPPPPVPPMAAPPQQNFPTTPAINAPPPSGALPTVATKPLKPGQMLFNFQDADIQAVVKTISQISGRNFLLDPRVKGKVTIISAKPVAKEAAYEIFVSALKAQGFSAVEGPGGIVKIVPEAEAKLSTGVRSGPYARNSDQWSTHVVVVQHASAPQLVPMLRPLMSPTALLSVYAPGNVLVITDTAASIRNVLKVIDKIDQPGSTEVTIIPIQHASVIDLAQLVGRFAEGAQIAAQPGQPPMPGMGGMADNRLVVVPDLRTNSLLVRADNPGRVAELRALVAKLDVPAKAGGQTHVVYLRNAEAKKLVEVLRGLLAGESRGGGVPTAPGAAGAAGAPASLIQADETSNALIISANDSTYNNLRGVIEKLDQRRAQVYVEALIVELQTDRALQFGVQWAGGAPGGNGGGVAGVQNFPDASGAGIINTFIAQGTNLSATNGLTLGYIGREITLPDSACSVPPCTTRGLGALARALQSDTKANVLSTPNMVMLDNAEAKIVVGQNVPFVTGSFAQAAGTSGAAVNPFQTIERKDVGLTLKIKPQISEGGGVKLVISQEISSVAPSAQSASDLITNKRSLDTTVIIDDGDTMVLGGLIEDKNSTSVTQVPILGSIPVLGELFKYRTRSKGKTNLMVFLRPVIIRNANDTYRVTADRYETIGAGSRANRGERAEVMKRFKPVKPVPKPVEPVEKDAVEKQEGATDAGEAIPAGEPQDSTAGSPAADNAGPKTEPE
jgi:general secretion pathway protein D